MILHIQNKIKTDENQANPHLINKVTNIRIRHAVDERTIIKNVLKIYANSKFIFMKFKKRA